MAYLGIEIGGTKLQLGVGPADGVLGALWRGPVNVAAGPEGIRRQIVAAVPELLARAHLTPAQVRGVGIGFGGPVDDATQTVVKSHQVTGWDDFPLVNWVREQLGWPAVLGNDADVAGLAEALHGAGKGLSPVFYITIGSGIGGGLILNGEIMRGCGRGAAEIGHLRMPVRMPTGLAFGPLEEVASGWAIEQRIRQALARGGAESLTCADVAELAERGDPIARDVLYQAWDQVAEAICHVIALVCPRRIVIGGGVSLMGRRLFLEPICERVSGRVFKPFANEYEIVLAVLGEEVVVHGAIALARRRFGG
jgi:glucokinase